jgi:phosphomannomutase / phosphoglucomutase
MNPYHPPSDLIISPSGMRGIIGKNLFPEVIIRFCEAFGTWLRQKTGRAPKVLVGMDTRTTGPMVKNLSLGALQSVGAILLDADVCPTPALLFGHKFYECDGTVIISASHNPPQYNGMKCLAPSGTFLSREELEEINQYFHGHQSNHYVDWVDYTQIKQIPELVKIYVSEMKKNVDLTLFSNQKEKKLKIVVDAGAGAGSGITSAILSNLNCDVVEINDKLNADGTYPRDFEPIIAHLQDLSKKIIEIGADIGFAHDCDADRIGLINEKGEIYPEDIILGIIVNHILKDATDKDRKGVKYQDIFMITNCASSLIFDDLTDKYGGQTIHTPVGERYLAEKMFQLMDEDKDHKNLIFGGEGSCGGFMLPTFNNTRDGMFAAVKIAEIMLKTNKKISELADELPTYVSVRKKVALESQAALDIMQKLKEYHQTQEIGFESIDNDIKINGDHEWTLVHPSNTEPIIRIITEATTRDKATKLLDEMDSIIKSLN